MTEGGEQASVASAADERRRTRPALGRILRVVGWYLASATAVALVSLPVVAEQAVEKTTFRDAIGTLPVEMALCRQGRSTIQTGLLGDVHWEHSAPWGFGVRARVTGPPVAGGTLASYVDRRFIRANVQFIESPDAAVSAYAREFRERIVRRVWVTSLVVGLVGGLLVLLVARGITVRDRAHRRAIVLGSGVAALVVSAAGAAVLFGRWECNGDPGTAYPFPDLPQLSFSSPQTRELALQVRPFIEKNTARIEQRAAAYQAVAETTFAEELQRQDGALAPRAGEVIVFAEADPQGALVATAVRMRLYRLLLDHVGRDNVALRTISGDITSNGTVAEGDFVSLEAGVAPAVTTVAVSGDHDSSVTQAQMEEHGMVVPDMRTEEVEGLRVSGANDVEHKSLFGQLISNDSGMTEQELGARLREEVSPDQAGIVLLHQPDAVAGYLGVPDMGAIRDLEGSATTPYDDGVPDVPPGTVNIGHLHDLDGPWVLWNTDGEEVTWTVVDQLGTTGGIEENSTFNRFSTPISVPLKPMAWRLQYFDVATGLQTGFVTIICGLDGSCRISDRTDVGLPLAPP